MGARRGGLAGTRGLSGAGDLRKPPRLILSDMQNSRSIPPPERAPRSAEKAPHHLDRQ